MDVVNDMHIIHHVESLRRKASYYWPNKYHEYGRFCRDYDFRPALNVHALILLLSSNKRTIKWVAEGYKSLSGNVRRKRERSESMAPMPSKRIRLDTSSRGSSIEENQSDEVTEDQNVMNSERRDNINPDDMARHRQIYPSFWQSCSNLIGEVDEDEETSFLQAYQFGLNVRYNKVVNHGSDRYVNDKVAAEWGWLKEEEELCSLFEAHQKDPSLSRDIDMGRFFVARYKGRFLAFSPLPDGKPGDPDAIKEASEKWLFLLPDVPWPDGITENDLEELDIQPLDIHQDFITACGVLQKHRRAKLETSLQLHVLPEGTYDPLHDFPFELRARFVFSLAIPNIYRPFDACSQNAASEFEDLQRRLLCFLSKTPLFRSHGTLDASMEATDTTIPFFLNAMRSAPPLAQDVAYELLQPDGLLPTLMPFQRRTVAWMLEREGKRITDDGTVVPVGVSATSMSPFWEEVELGGGKFFFNRLTSALSPTPILHTAMGGILAEEPGLGKTMECISLILLNPAPERNPSNKRWDPEAQLDVKEIKTTLIVTPPALASQWMDEIAAHAPGLKVFIYGGWANIKVPITEADLEAEKAKRRFMATSKPQPKSQAKGKRGSNGKMHSSKGKGIKMGNSESSDSRSGDPDASSDSILDWPGFINQFDVCITTYKVLQTDMQVARAPPVRSRRKNVEYRCLRRPRSPLVLCEWYRVIMDEVQMMGAGKSEEMVSLIPRLSSFAVSGTPARAQVSDLIGVLRFLRIDDLVTPARMWKRLLKHAFKDLFASFFRKYSVRTLKSSVQNELTIPQQRRYLVSIELGRVERHVYDQALEETLADLGLDARGVAEYEGWEVDPSVLRNALRRLRGICTHPQVGQLQRQGDKLNKSGALKSMADVLESMKDQNWRNLTDDRRAKVVALARLAQLQQHCSDDLNRYKRALEYLRTAETEADQLIDDIKTAMAVAQHSVKDDIPQTEAQASRDLMKTGLHNDQMERADKGKGREIERDAMSPADADSDEGEDVEDRDLPKTQANDRRIALQARLRECLVVLHRVKFLQGDVCHVLGSSYSEGEDAAYADAETLRKDILKSTEEAANKAMRRLSVATTEKRVTGQALQISLPFLKGGGIRSTHLFEEANEIIEEVLNQQSALLWQWRTKIVELLTRRLNSAGEQADGEEYARTLDTQGEAEIYLQGYAALLADRQETILAERTLLAMHEGREKTTRKTLAATRAKQTQKDLEEVPDDIEVQPEHEVLHHELLQQRKELQLPERALKSVMVDLSSVAARIPKDDDPEKIIAKDGAARLRALIANLQKLTDKLNADHDELRKAFNERIVYFRQLQEISDTVAEVQWEGTLADAVQATNLENTNLGTRINTWRARQRYLEYLATGRVCNDDEDDDDAVCILCQCEFLRGCITQCAHMFCEGCMKAWIRRGQGSACPVCRSPIDPRQMQRFTMQEDRPPPKPVPNKGEVAPASYREIHYNMINPNLFADIQSMETNGSYGSKIQTLVQHLLYIQLVDPGAKSIVFSAWADSLTIVEHALLTNGIPCIRLDQNQGRRKDGGAKRFRTDADLQVLLLHGERDNAGLNVTCASRVFLLESVVNHGFEVQAIARIDRMGQTRATEVFCYYAKDTVEKNILDLAARQGLSLYTKDNSVGSVNVTSFATDSEKNLVDSPMKSGRKGQPVQKGDFIFKVNDMLAILFPHMFEDIDFLLPPDARAEETSPVVDARAAPVRRLVRVPHVNAEAGPSRLPSS